MTTTHSALDAFHPVVSGWFRAQLGAPTEAQQVAWPALARGEHTLVTAPTGSGKTLAAFLGAIDRLVRRGLAAPLEDRTRILYVSPLRALSNDVENNLQRPLAGIRAQAAALGLGAPEIRTAVRTGDTPAAARARMLRRPPHILVTTPESLYLLLGSAGGRRALADVEQVIVDEIHALVGDKRGSHLALSLARLDALCSTVPVRVGLSATVEPLEEVAAFLTGNAPCTLVETGRHRRLDLDLELPGSALEAVASNEVWEEIYDRLTELVRGQRTTLVFVPTRKTAERMTRHLAERLGEDSVATHHGALSRQRREATEDALRGGRLRAVVATASLELGIDVGDVELVCQIGSPRGISTLLQRVGRANHSPAGVPRGRVFPTSRDDLVECLATLQAARRGLVDRVRIPRAPLDILAQQLVAACAVEDWDEDAAFALVRRAAPYADLPREDFDAVVHMLCEGWAAGRRRGAGPLLRDALRRRLHARRGARILAATCGGAIPELADYDVVLVDGGGRVGSVHEDFAIESSSGDVFQLGNTSWRIVRVEPGVVHVEDARGALPTLPFWLGEAATRSDALSREVALVRARADAALGADVAEAGRALARSEGCSAEIGDRLAEYLGAARFHLGLLPTQTDLVVERFFDEAGTTQLVVHAPFGARINRALGLALRKRFCQRFDFELQAAATDDAIVLSLGPTHSFPLEEVAGYLNAAGVRAVLVQALLDAPMFRARFRWNAGRALAVPRFAGGRRVPPRLQRLRADDLLTSVFPDQVACQENRSGPREIPDHPLVRQTIDDCLHEAMDIEGLEALLRDLASGERRWVFRDVTTPSPLAAEILTARPYAFLDDAPLEERRTQAVLQRRLRPGVDSGHAALDPLVIDEVRAEAWPAMRDPDEVLEALDLAGTTTALELGGALDSALALVASGHAVRRVIGGAERFVLTAALPSLARAHDARAADYDAAVRHLVQGRLEVSGPVTASSLASSLGCTLPAVTAALHALEAAGVAMRGTFDPRLDADQWCERGLLARIHRRTLERLRREIEPVTVDVFVRFLERWHGLAGTPLPPRLAALRLEGYDVPAALLEPEVLAPRIEDYEPTMLDDLTRSGEFAWLRLRGPRPGGPGPGRSLRTTPITLLARGRLDALAPPGASSSAPTELGSDARLVLEALERRGASFFGDLVRATRLLEVQVEGALLELAAAGIVTSDGYAGLRALLRRSASVRGASGLDRGGRFAILPATVTAPADETVEAWAQLLLQRWGVVCRAVAARERGAPAWRELARHLRTMEARGELRGGRFLAIATGEQYAVPEAVTSLRALRREAGSGAVLVLSAWDPLNLTGAFGESRRIPAIFGHRIALRDGIPVAVRGAGRVQWLADGLGDGERWDLELALVRGRAPRAPPASRGRAEPRRSVLS